MTLQALLPNLGHQHSRVRLVVIEALGKLVLAGCVPAGLVESLVCPALRPVAYDRTPAVREALFSAVAGWLGGDGLASDEVAKQLPSKSNAASLLPLLLVGVTDPQPALASSALRQIEDVGQAWERRSKGGVDADPANAAATSAPASVPADGTSPMEGVVEAAGASSEAAAMQGEIAEAASSEEEASVAASQLGPPYTGRPAPGARDMVRELLPLLLQPLLSEVAEWTVALRSSASRQLHSVIVFAEAGATPQVGVIPRGGGMDGGMGTGG